MDWIWPEDGLTSHGPAERGDAFRIDVWSLCQPRPGGVGVEGAQLRTNLPVALASMVDAASAETIDLKKKIWPISESAVDPGGSEVYSVAAME